METSQKLNWNIFQIYKIFSIHLQFIINFLQKKEIVIGFFIDSFITKNNRSLKSTSLGITEESSNKFVPSSLFHDIPERKGKYVGKVLLVGFRNVLKKEDIYKYYF